jgi:DNA sulfur modification protein DndD
MFIKEIEINNFRIYKGLNTISVLPEDEEQNIIVVSGKNGFGKTTFLMSLVWCLYGKNMIQVDEIYAKEIRDKKNYANYIAGSLNRLAKDEGQTKFSVAITFTDVKIPEINCKEVKITRTYDVVTSAADSVEVLIDGYKNQVTDDLSNGNQSGEEIFIRDFILPIEIAKFFLFDAEKIVSLAEVNSTAQRKQLSNAYSEVLGIQKYEDLKSTLELKQDDYRRKSATPDDKRDLNTLSTAIENDELSIDGFENDIAEIEEKRNYKQKQAEEIQQKLIREGEKMTLEELNKIKEEKAEIEKQKEALQDKLKEYFDVIPFGLAGETMLGVADQLKLEKSIHEQNYQTEELNEKTENILMDLERERTNRDLIFKPDIRNFYEDQIKNLIKKHFYSDIDEIPADFKALHDFSSAQSNEFNQMLDTIKHSFRDGFSRLNSDYAFLKNQTDSITRKIQAAEKSAEDEYVADLRKKKEALEKDIDNLSADINVLNQNIGEAKSQIKANKQKQEALRKKIDEASQYKDKEAQTKKIIGQLQEFIVKFKEQKKKSLEEKMLAGLKTLMHKKDFISKVVVDISLSGDDIDIVLYDQRNHKIDKGSLSMGERQMYASALLHALVDESDFEFPVFIDSPMQKFDEEHAKNIIKYFYPTVSKQVVIFPLINKELTADEFKLLQPKVCKSFLINNLTTDESEFIPIDPSKFLDTYNHYYNADN